MGRIMNKEASNHHGGVAAAPVVADGDLVRSTNELYVPFGIGRIQKIKGPQAKVEFNPSVFMQPPYRSENKILQLGEATRAHALRGHALARRSASFESARCRKRGRERGWV